MATKHIALITCSTRKPRIGPFIASYVQFLLKPKISPQVTLTSLDLASFALPLMDEPTIPVMQPKENPTPHYTQEHTRNWSSTIAKYDAYIFVTPQYNWSLPGSLKNALDFLFWEWNGKPAGIVSYGGHGGVKAAAHLRDVLGGLKMRGTEKSGALFIGVEMAPAYAENGAVDEKWVKKWKDEGMEKDVIEMYEELEKTVLGEA